MTSPGLRWLPTCTLPGAWQMAIDAWLLQQVSCGNREGPLLRFYSWSRPTLSLGKHQRTLDPRWCSLASQGRLAIVRRPTGGAAVLHGGDLTYALIWPNPPRSRRQAYHLTCRWLQDAFAEVGLPLAFGESPARLDQANCFATNTAADLVHAAGEKRIGSAQLWKGCSLLQHGSIAIEPDQALWAAVFDQPAPNLPLLPLSATLLEHQLFRSALRWLCPSCQDVGRNVDSGFCRQEPLLDWEWLTLATTVSSYEVGGLDGTGLLASAIPRATGSRARPSG